MNSMNGLPLLLGRAAGMRRLALPEVLFTVGQGEGFALHRLSVGAAFDDQEVAQVRDHDDAVGSQILLDLRAGGNRLHLGLGALGLHRATRRQLPSLGGIVGLALELVGGEQPAVGDAAPLVLRMDNAADFGLEGLADGVEQAGQCGIVRRFGHAAAAYVDFLQLGQIIFQHFGQ